VPTVFYVVPYGWDAFGLGSATTPAPPERQPSKGQLRVELQPEIDAQMYVDGHYVGMVSEVSSGLPLDPGLHSLQLRAEGYQTLALDVQVTEGRSITYRGSLPATSPAPTPVPDRPPVPIERPTPAGPIYFIPGCYLGNVAPQEVTLPPGCDPAAVKMLSVR